MKLRGKEIRQCARGKLRGKYGLAIGSVIFVSLLYMFVNDFASQIFSGKTTFQLVLAEVAALVITTLMSIFTAGSCLVFYNISRGEGYDFKNLFAYVKSNPDRVMTVGVVLALIAEISSLPLIWVEWKMSKIINTSDMSAVLSGTASQEYLDFVMRYMMLQIALMLLQMVLNFLLSIPFAMSYWILADEPELSGKEILIKSIGMMKNRMWDYIKLILGFLPAAILCSFTMGLGFFWLVPNVHMAECEFFMRIKNEYNTKEKISIQEA